MVAAYEIPASLWAKTMQRSKAGFFSTISLMQVSSTCVSER